MGFIEKRSAYEKHTGIRHTFEIYHRAVGTRYIVMLDGAFLADAENLPGAAEEIDDTIKWFGWTNMNPNFA